jgi:hypothetical protein
MLGTRGSRFKPFETVDLSVLRACVDFEYDVAVERLLSS